MTRRIAVAAVVLSLLPAAAAWGQEQTPKAEVRTQNAEQAKPTETSASSAPSAVKAPSPELLKAWERLQAVLELRQGELRRREEAIEQLTQAQIALSSFNAQGERLAAEFRKLLPAGYRWDAASKSLVKIAKPPEEQE